MVLYEMHTTPKAFRIVSYFSLIVLVAGLILVFSSITQISKIIAFSPQIAAGCVVMILTIELVGVPRRAILTRFWPAGLFTYALYMGGILGAACLFMIVYSDFEDITDILSTVSMFGLYGFIPSLIIGFLGAAALKENSK